MIVIIILDQQEDKPRFKRRTKIIIIIVIIVTCLFVQGCIFVNKVIVIDIGPATKSSLKAFCNDDN